MIAKWRYGTNLGCTGVGADEIDGVKDEDNEDLFLKEKDICLRKLIHYEGIFNVFFLSFLFMFITGLITLDIFYTQEDTAM